MKHLTVRWIGPQSRLKQIGSPNSDIDIAIVLSGPEPQRSNFEQKLIKQFSSLPHKIILVRGLRNPTTNLDLPGNTTILNYADAEILSRVINQSKFIICRSGYSTIMDLDNLGGKVLFVPTPGQPEQMYLAEYFEQKNIAEMQSQLNLDITSAWSRRNDYSGFPIRAILTSCCTDS
ncbi:MAG: hypothetical protein KJP00_02935 [Bacteroidia bacterium]|nr:hypothetical protein [Bacteroidia bacterium]